MKKIMTLVAAAMMAVGLHAQNEETIKFLSGNADWNQMFVDDGEKYIWPGRTFEASDKLTAKALWAGALLKDKDGKDVTFNRESGTTQTYTIEFGATPTIKLQMCVNCVIPNQYGGGNSTMAFKALDIKDNVASFTVSAEDCFFTGTGYKKNDEGKWVLDKEYKKDPQNVTSITLQACDVSKDAVYPAVINIKSIKRVISGAAPAAPSYTLTLADLDFSKEGATAVGGWGGNLKSEIKGGVDVITFTKQEHPHEVQVDFENVYPKGAKIQLTMEAMGSVEGSIKAALQNPNNFKGCGDFDDIKLTTDYQTITKTVTCTGDNAKRLLLNVGQYEGAISIKNVKIEALDVPQETVTISPSGYSTYAAYYPVAYSNLGLKAYTVKLNKDKTSITMTEVEGVVPAGVAVLLKGKADTDYALTKADGWQNVTSDLKMSDGTITSTDKANVYGLATVDGQEGFYKASGEQKIPAKCGYLEVTPAAAHAIFYSLGDITGNTTGIADVKAETVKADVQMYNLAGQKVGKGYKGIVIKNGKKMIQK